MDTITRIITSSTDRKKGMTELVLGILADAIGLALTTIEIVSTVKHH